MNIKDEWLIEILCDSDSCIHISPNPWGDEWWCIKLTEESKEGQYIECSRAKCPIRIGKGE